MILEGIVTTENGDGSVNVSPMGPTVDRSISSLTLRPFPTSATYQNLCRRGEGVFHVTDDVELLAHAAVGHLATTKTLPLSAQSDHFHVLADACRWYAFQVDKRDESEERMRLVCRIVDQGRIRDFWGWNRAQYAVLEAAILATRVHLLPAKTIQGQLDQLAPLVEKTGGDKELRAFDFLRNYVREAQEVNG